MGDRKKVYDQFPTMRIIDRTRLAQDRLYNYEMPVGAITERTVSSSTPDGLPCVYFDVDSYKLANPDKWGLAEVFPPALEGTGIGILVAEKSDGIPFNDCFRLAESELVPLCNEASHGAHFHETQIKKTL